MGETGIFSRIPGSVRRRPAMNEMPEFGVRVPVWSGQPDERILI